MYDFIDAASENPTFYADLTTPQSLNKYQYTYNNPLRYTDPDGHCPDGAAGVLCRAAPVVISIPGAREALAAAALVVIGAEVIKRIPGDITQGDGSCPGCDGLINAFQKEKAKEQAQQQAEQQRHQQNQNNAQTGEKTKNLADAEKRHT